MALKIHPGNPNVLTDKELKELGIDDMTKSDLVKEFKRLQKNTKAKARRIKKKGGATWKMLGGYELENKDKGKAYNTNYINPLMNMNEQVGKPEEMSNKELRKWIKTMTKFNARGGENYDINQAKKRVITAIAKRGFNTSDTDDVIRYIEEMPLETFAEIFTLEEAYETLEDIYLTDDFSDNFDDYLDRFKSYSGYYAQTGEETEKQWSSRFKKRYGRNVNL